MAASGESGSFASGSGVGVDAVRVSCARTVTQASISSAATIGRQGMVVSARSESTAYDDPTENHP
jgi:hypothetical protein